MKLSNSPVFEDWLIDRLAFFGKDHTDLAKLDFSRVFKIELPDDLIENVAGKRSDEIKKRIIEMRDEVARDAPSLVSRLEKICSGLEETAVELKEKGDLRTYGSIINTQIRGIELIGKMTGDLKSLSPSKSPVDIGFEVKELVDRELKKRDANQVVLEGLK